MPRLPNDCFANSADMISVDQAREQIAKVAKTCTDIEQVSIDKAGFRILGEDIIANMDVPPAGNSAVDGYAFSYTSYQDSRTLECVGRSAAGAPFSGSVQKGECIQIFTGALLPAGCNTIAMVEDVTVRGKRVFFPEGLKDGANHRKAGEDLKKGSLILKAGTRLRPQELGQLASIGICDIPVHTKLKVGLFSTGDELCNPGDAHKPGSIFDTNRFMIRTLLENYGCSIQDYGILEDKLATVKDALAKAADECDLLLTSGGVSMGDEDHVKAAVEATGNLHFWRIAIKPGRPLAMGQVKSTAFVGLPGNPVAALVCALQFVRPLITGLSGLNMMDAALPVFGKSSFLMDKKPGRTEWLRGRYRINEQNEPVIDKYSQDGSGIISSLTWANGLIELGEDVNRVEPGNMIRFYPFTELFK
ncbi:gephyrin-like molybdotransferase Glp [Sneathiella sp.]|jgi:molybdopterin molybdotransferase|uniref:molybdopterin molybdotransferase MoeA n=1 Tax=Sneathiella sp. TaxID=1964365 RepID=UPI0039E2C965